MTTNLEIGLENITYREIVDTVVSGGKISLSSDESFIRRINKSREVLESKLDRGETVYGVTTGYGDSCNVLIPKDLQRELPLHLSRYHQCGLGDVFDETLSKTIQIVRIVSLSKGYSAVRLELLQFMVDVYNKGVVPRIPQEGSVGASGDLTPLAYYAAVLQGEGSVFYKNEVKPTMEVFEKLNIKPITLVEKEALALMNGTAVMTAVACHVFVDSYYLVKIASRLTAGSSVSLLANSNHFSDTLFKAKPHKGTSLTAKLIRKDLSCVYENKKLTRLQDRYSIRCAPHIIGVLYDGLLQFEDLLNIEINSANDNPLVDIENENVFHGGNFYGGHIAFIMDSLKNLVANIADLMDRQLALLVDTKFNNGLPANLSAAEGEGKFLSHGLKAVQISSSAWTAEALKNTLPASIFSRSTECHNQDKVSMGTIAARDARRILGLTQQVASALVIAVNQAIEIRVKQKELKMDGIGEPLYQFHENCRKLTDFITNDRPLEGELRVILSHIQERSENFV